MFITIFLHHCNQNTSTHDYTTYTVINHSIFMLSSPYAKISKTQNTRNSWFIYLIKIASCPMSSASIKSAGCIF